MKDFRNLEVWQKSREMVSEIYKITQKFPKDELYGLVSQMRRSAFSIGANISEGCGRGSDPDFGRFIQMALGSASELEYFIIISHDLGFLTTTDLEPLESKITEIKKMLSGLLKSLRTIR